MHTKCTMYATLARGEPGGEHIYMYMHVKLCTQHHYTIMHAHAHVYIYTLMYNIQQTHMYACYPHTPSCNYNRKKYVHTAQTGNEGKSCTTMTTCMCMTHQGNTCTCTCIYMCSFMLPGKYMYRLQCSWDLKMWS